MRNRELDGLRGLAALAVAIGHCNTHATGLEVWSKSLVDIPSMRGTQIAGRLLHVLFPADASVIVFFVLSGYVLWGSFQKKVGNPIIDAVPYVVGRTYRLIPVAMMSAILMSFLVNSSSAETAKNAFLLSYSLNSPVWSLQVEVIGSALIFCTFALTRISLAFLIMTIVLSVICAFWMPHYLILFLPTFFMGSYIHYIRTDLLRPNFLIPLSYAFLVLADFIFGHGYLSRAVQFASAWILVASVSVQRPAILSTRVSQFLGEISYPFYLTHQFGMLSAVYLLGFAGIELSNPSIEMAALVALSLTITLPLAWGVHWLVELPGMAAGSKLHREIRAYIQGVVAQDMGQAPVAASDQAR